MRRLLGIVLLAIGIPVLLALGVGAKEGSGSGYKVVAIFDNAAYAVKGEDVRIAGVTVGRIDKLDVAFERKAQIAFTVDTAGFTPFHTDAHCTIRPQSLIGEKYVECTPGTTKQPVLPTIPDGRENAGAAYLPLARTSSPVDIDLIGNINRLPYRQRLAIIINEFGTALAGRGDDLNRAIHRANPALRETDKVLGILAQQNRVLARLAVESDRVIAPLAANRRRVANFIVEANKTGTATAERSAAIERSFELFPGFLRQLQPTLQQLSDYADQTTPVLADLHTAAPALNRFTAALGPFSSVATKSVVSLGKTADIGRPALKQSLPLVTLLAQFAENALPVGKDLAALTKSFDKTGGIERVMDYIFFQVTAINGFDGVSHYLRAALMANLCSAYATAPAGGCNANFTNASSAGASQKTGDPLLDKLHAQLADGSGPDGTGGKRPKTPKNKKKDSPNPFETLRELTNPRVAHERNSNQHNATGGGNRLSDRFGHQGPEDQALDYLLGNDQ